MTANSPMLSLVVPVLNECESLRPLYEEILRAAESLPGDFEILFIDDGSTDGSWREIERLHHSDARVRAIRFRRNFGKAAALQAGFECAKAERIVTLDADLQDDPAEIHSLLAALDLGYDLVSGWKRVRHDPWHKVLPSRIFNAMVSRFTGVQLHDHNCGLKAYRAEVLAEIQLYGELHRFTPVLAKARGFRVGEIEVNHRPRRHGESKYGWTRFINGFLDLMTVKFLTSYQHRPQHLMGTLGLASLALGSLGMTYLALVWVLTRLGLPFEPIGNRPLLVFSATAVLVGLQIFSMGLIGELIAFRLQKEKHIYSIAQQLGFPLAKHDSLEARSSSAPRSSATRSKGASA